MSKKTKRGANGKSAARAVKNTKNTPAVSFRDGAPLTLAAWKKRLVAGYYSSVSGARRATGHAVRCGNMTAAEKTRADKLAGEHKFGR